MFSCYFVEHVFRALIWSAFEQVWTTKRYLPSTATDGHLLLYCCLVTMFYTDPRDAAGDHRRQNPCPTSQSDEENQRNNMSEINSCTNTLR